MCGVPLEVVGDERHQQADDEHDGGEGGRDHRPGEWRLPREDVDPQQHTEDHQGKHVDGVEDDQERDHAAGRLAALHPRLSQRPIGEQNAARAAG